MKKVHLQMIEYRSYADNYSSPELMSEIRKLLFKETRNVIATGEEMIAELKANST